MAARHDPLLVLLLWHRAIGCTGSANALQALYPGTVKSRCFVGHQASVRPMRTLTDGLVAFERDRIGKAPKSKTSLAPYSATWAFARKIVTEIVGRAAG